jgi:hypothetical protein
MTRSWLLASVVDMADDPRTTTDAEPDLRLLLAEADREDPFLATPQRDDAPEGEEALDEQILAGLVTP